MKYNYSKPLSEKQFFPILIESEEKMKHIDDLLHQVADAINDAFTTIDGIIGHAKEESGGCIVAIKDYHDFKKACGDTVIISGNLMVVKALVTFIEGFLHLEKTSELVKRFYKLETIVKDNLKVLDEIKNKFDKNE